MQETPLLQALFKHRARQASRFHVPSHKGRGLTSLLDIGLDLTELDGLDDLHVPSGPIAAAQALMAEAVGAEQSYFCVGGASNGLHALILATCRPGEKLLVPRHSHRSVLGGLILAGAQPVYLEPLYDPELQIPVGVSTEELAAKIAAHPDVKGALLIHPTYQGHAGPLQSQVALLHRHGLLALVDEAHGTHFSFHPAFPQSALQAGADGVVQSWHKSGGSFTQSAAVQLQGQRLDRSRVAAMLRLVQSTSPSYLLLASLDLARHQLVAGGQAYWEPLWPLRRRLTDALPISEPRFGPGWGYDPTKLVIDCRAYGRSGYEVADHLGRRGVDLELAGPSYTLALLAPTDPPEWADRLLGGLRQLERGDGPLDPWPGPPPWTDPVVTPREASLAEKENLPLREAAGRIAAEYVAPYPPGVPVLAPGEEVSQGVILYLEALRRQGVHLQGPADPTLERLQVMKE